MSKYIRIKNQSCLDTLQNHQHGEVAYCEDTEELWIYDANKKTWMKFQVNNKGINLNLYDLNKSVISQLEPLTVDEISTKATMLNDYEYECENSFYMLLCKDFSYYTIFTRTITQFQTKFSEAVISIITELGEVYSIDRLEDASIEIWIKPTGEETPYAFYLFPYDAGVVTYG